VSVESQSVVSVEEYGECCETETENALSAHERHGEEQTGRGLRSAPASSESLNHSATVNPKLRESHCLLGRQRVSGRDDLEMFGRRDGNPNFRAVLTPDCSPPATSLALVSVDNVRLINDRHESCFSARDSSPLGEFRLHNSKRRLSASGVHTYTRSQDVAGSLALASPAVVGIDRHMTARKSRAHQRVSQARCEALSSLRPKSLKSDGANSVFVAIVVGENDISDQRALFDLRLREYRKVDHYLAH